MANETGMQCNQNEQKNYMWPQKHTNPLLRKVMATMGGEGGKAYRNQDMIQEITIAKKKAKFLSFLYISFREAEQFLS